MNELIIIEAQPMPAEMANLFEKAKRNRLWLNEHIEELEIYKRYRGCYVAAAGGELFVADTPEQIEQLVKDKYPDDVPHIRYIPQENRSRTYAYSENFAKQFFCYPVFVFGFHLLCPR